MARRPTSPTETATPSRPSAPPHQHGPTLNPSGPPALRYGRHTQWTDALRPQLWWRHSDADPGGHQHGGRSHSGPASTVHPRHNSERQGALRDRRYQPAHPDPHLKQPSRDTHRRRGGAQPFRFRRCGMIRPWPATKIWRSGYGSSAVRLAQSLLYHR
jgi:hypothetical protein